MPMPSKFTARRRQLILVALGAGASRRVAAEIAQIDHSTLGGWLRRGARASEGSRYRSFHDQVLQAESDPHRPQLLPLVEIPPREVNAAWAFLEVNDEWVMPEPQPPEPVLVRVLHHDGTPISGGTHD